MALPTLKVEIAFASDPLDDTPTWVDVTAYVRQSDGVQIRRGGSGDPDAPDHAGTASFVLDNRSRLFDWSYTAGTYYGQLTPRKQVRISGTSGSDYPIFRGWVTDGFKCELRGMGKDAVAVVTCHDALGVLAGKRLTGDPLADYVAATVAWRQADASRVVSEGSAASAVTNLMPVNVGQVVLAAPLIPAENSTAITATGAYWCATTETVSLGNSVWAVSLWVQSTADGSDYFGSEAPIVDSSSQYMSIDASGMFIAGSGAPTAWDLTSSRPINDGTPHHIFINSGAPGYLFVDGVVDDSHGNVSVLNIERIFSSTGGTPTASQILASTTIQDLICMGVCSDPATVAQRLFLLSKGIYQESSSERVTRLLDEADWPTGWRDVSTATRATCGPLNFNGQSILTGLQQVERTEQGRLYAALDGKVTFRQRYYAYEDAASNTVQMTFSDDGSNQGYRTFGHKRGDLDVCNDATVTNGTIQARSTDSTSQTTYDTNANTYDTVLSTYSEIAGMAAGIVFLRKDARARLDPIQVHSNAASWPDLLSLELADRIAIESTPMGVGTQMVEKVLVESVQWDISDQGWKFTVAGMPVPPDPVDVGFWSLDVSELDAGTALAY